MPYAKKRNYKKNQKNSYAIAKQALSKVNKLTKQVEVKYIDTSISEATITSATGRVFVVNNLPTVGTGDSNMVGDKLTLRSLNYRAEMVIGAGVYGTVRLIYFVRRDKWAAAGALPTSTQILETVSPYSQYNRNSTLQFSVIKDILIRKDGEDKKPFLKENFNVKGKVVDYDGTTAQGHTVWCLVVHSLTSTCSIDGTSRQTYTDM